MLHFAIVGTVLGMVFFAAWYWAFLRYNMRRGRRVLCWLKDATAAHGQISGVNWISPSHFRARLNLSGCAFRQPLLEVRLAPRQMPARWAVWLWRNRQETLTFQANLTCPPGESLEIGRSRWSGLDRPRPHHSAGWPRLTVATLFISNQPSWEPQISARINGVVATREYEFLAVSFRPQPPHFSVTFSLQETLRHPSGELAIFESLRELAEGSPTSRM